MEHHILDKLTDGILLTDKNFKIEYINPAGLKLLDFKANQLIGKPLIEIHTGKTKKLVENIMEQFLSGSLSFWQTMVSYRNRYINMHIKSLQDGNNFNGIIVELHNLTLDSINESLAQRQEKYEVMAQMAAGLADEMRNPLTSVKGFMQLIHHRMRKNRQKEYVELALDELKRMERLIRNFLLFSSPDAPILKLCSINKLLQELINNFKLNLQNENVNIELGIPQEEFFMCIDEEQIKQVILNLLQNSVEALPGEGGNIKVKMLFLKTEKYLELKIEDNGCGIHEQYWPHIFEPFFTTKDFSSGLGLTIAERLVEAHGGYIEGCKNNKGGTTMTLFLPFTYVPKKTS